MRIYTNEYTKIYYSVVEISERLAGVSRVIAVATRSFIFFSNRDKIWNYGS
jgi:hypothetical protein